MFYVTTSELACRWENYYSEPCQHVKTAIAQPLTIPICGGSPELVRLALMKLRNRALGAITMIMLTLLPAAADEAIALAPGPCMDKRKEILAYLDKARKAGIGVKPYTEALERIETNVKAGQSEDEIKKQVGSLISALAQQVNNLKVLKVSSTYRAVTGSSSSGSGSGSGSGKAGAKAVVPVSEMESHLLKLVNQHRAQAGLGALGANGQLADIARAHAEDMAKRGFFSHVNPDGLDPNDRARMAGWGGLVRENIGFSSNRGDGLATTEAVDVTLMNSPPHRATILNNVSAQVGIGIAYDSTGGIRACQLFFP